MERHLIKKYANRKLYDTNTSKYITLEGISDLLKQGEEIEVVDRESGRDLTPLILSQIVMSEEKRTRKRPHPEPDGETWRGQALLDYVRGALHVPAVLVGSEVERRRGDFESVIDAAIERALERLSIPSRREVERLNQRIDELSARVNRGARAGAATAKSRPSSSRTRKAAG